ncbi:CheR family methyltransferase [Psychrobacter proteolyticus]|uniref:CheR family methyltransferase n=1 Tax=Psychrobacter proteolyticus TaxID=147825 RepID=UPI003D049B62
MNNFTKAVRGPFTIAEFALTSTLMQFAPVNLRQWQNYIEQEIGFVLPERQLQWLVNAIEGTAISNGLSAQELWCQLPKNTELRQCLLDNVLIHESRFFRHQPSIDFVVKCALQHKQVSDIDSLVRIWSVGCANGQEVWSLAMSLSAKRFLDYKILGTDVSEQAIKNARLGQYDERQRGLIPQPFQQFIEPFSTKRVKDKVSINSLSPASKMMDVNSNTYGDWQVAPTLQSYVSFAVHNIFEKEPPTAHLQHVIICQNMLLYFRKFDQRDILNRLSEQCALHGYIILAPGEALFWRPSNMRRIAHPQVNVWQKIGA